MKLPFQIYDLRFTISKKSASSAAHRKSPIVNHKFRSGVALVITLIMLSVTLIMAVAFLAVARRERNAVTTTTDTTTARIAADSALAAAQAQIAANIFSSTNVGAYNFHLLVSTNYINYTTGYTVDSASTTNVYYYYPNGSLLTGSDLIQNIANLLFLPRAPVFINTNSASPLDFRFYLDLNRNGRYEANGWVAEVNSQGLTNGNFVFETGDPEWIGVLEHPDQPHGPNNQFIARYAFFAQPIGNSLDLNYIHNQTHNPNLNSAQDGYFRNEGVGSWELNLAAFLADLNTNQWNTVFAPYAYNQFQGGVNSGNAFSDAFSLLAYRYNSAYNTLAVPSPAMYNALVYGGIDGYTLGNLMTNTTLAVPAIPLNGVNAPWAGSDNTNRFFSLPSDLFDPTKSSTFFTNRLYNSGISNSTYDRYTFYRMLDQLGTESTPDENRMNLNYDNLDANGNVVPGKETNAIAWTTETGGALRFFTNAVDRLLRTYSANWFATNPTNFLATYYGIVPTTAISPNGYGLTNTPYFGMTNEVPTFGITNIPVYVNDQFVYTPAVNRLLQLAANIYDASTNLADVPANIGNNYPSVFRPEFTVIQNGSYRDVHITGYNYVDVVVPSDVRLSTPFDVTEITAVISSGLVPSNDNIYGVPWIIGAKKGFPAFNQLAMINSAQFERRLEVVRNTIAGPVALTNQLVAMTVNNNLGVSFWNSYASDYVGSGTLTFYVVSTNQIFLTNSILGVGNPYVFRFGTNYNFTFINNRWPGSQWGANGSGQPQPNAFAASTWTNNLIPGLAYNFANGGFIGTNIQGAWDSTLAPLPQFGLLATNRLQAYILDGNHVIDYVQFRGPIDATNMTVALQDPGPNYGGGAPYYLWSTNLSGKGTGPSWGIQNQLTISRQPLPVNTVLPGSAKWTATQIPGLPNTTLAQQKFFDAAFTPSHAFNYNGQPYVNNQLVSQAPYTATRTIFGANLYQVNDPLVHYLASDLDAGVAAIWAKNNPMPNGIWHQDNGVVTYSVPVVPDNNIANGQSRYQPWGQTQPAAYPVSSSAYNFDPKNMLYKDSLVWGSDFWDFPTNRYPTMGWLGRVHRGTPWQTVYLKASDELLAVKNAKNVGLNTWQAWTGNKGLTYGQYYDAANSAPVQDRLLFDLFTTSFSDNASRGQLSVNQTHLAAWSALFSGMVALSNPTNSTTTYTNLIIDPAGVNGTNSALGILLAGINNKRSIFTNADGVVGSFEHRGDILSVPTLTEQSPFLNLNTTQQQQGISDEVYEWLPQQMMSLLTCPTGPRYVVYCYGQTLRPAPNSVVTSSSALPSGLNPFGMVTNYQVTAESATRAVIRLEKHVTATGTNYSTVVESYNVLGPN